MANKITRVGRQISRGYFAGKIKPVTHTFINIDPISAACAPSIKNRATCCFRNKKDFPSHLDPVCNRW